LNGFLDGDTNNSGLLPSGTPDVTAEDTMSPFIISDNPFNQDVASDTGGYDLTHIGAVRGGAVTNTQFDNWTVETENSDGFAVQLQLKV